MILAPVVVNRKGEQLELFDELRAQGFVRVRVDGKVYEIDAAAEARQEQQAHDRGRRRPAEGARRLEAAAGRIVRDRAAPRRRPRHRGRDGHAATSTCSRPSSPARSATTRCRSSSRACSRSTTRWAPARAATAWARSASSIPSASSRSRSSRSPPARSRAGTGATSSTSRCCRASRSTSASISSGRSRSCRSASQQVMLYGSGDEKIPFTYLSERGKPMMREHAFEGIVPNLERRYRETDSVMVREELAKYLNTKPCPECDGTRLRREARHVKVGSGGSARAIFEISGLPLQGGVGVLRQPRARRPQAGDRRPDRQGDRQPAAVPEQRRPRLPVARPLGRDALGRRGAAHPPRLADRLRA